MTGFLRVNRKIPKQPLYILNAMVEAPPAALEISGGKRKRWKPDLPRALESQQEYRARLNKLITPLHS